MRKSGFISRRITGTFSVQLKDVVSLSVSNYGTAKLSLTVNDVVREVPAFNAAYGVPFGAFNLPGDGTSCDLRLEFNFVGGTADAILDYRILQDECSQAAQ